jgi:hypothetical protein
VAKARAGNGKAKIWGRNLTSQPLTREGRSMAGGAVLRPHRSHSLRNPKTNMMVPTNRAAANWKPNVSPPVSTTPPINPAIAPANV